MMIDPQEISWAVGLDPQSILGDYQREIGITLTSFRSVMHVMHAGEFPNHAENDSSDRFMKFSLTGMGEEHIVQIQALLISNAFRSLVASTVQLMDKLIGTQELFQDFVVGEDIGQFTTDAEYVEHRIKLAIAAVGRRKRLQAPAKVAHFGRLKPFSSAALSDYIEIRNILEHRHGIADRECVLLWQQIVPTINGESAGEGTLFEAGDQLGIRIIEKDRPIPVGSPCELTEDEVHGVHGTLHMTIGPELVAHLLPDTADH